MTASGPPAESKNGARRRFLHGAGRLGAATLAAPIVARAAEPEFVWRFQSAWPTRDILHEYALDFAKKVNEMSGGRLKIEMHPSGAIVKAFAVIDAVHKGSIDGGHSVPNYWRSKNGAFSLFGSGPAFGLDGNLLLAWMEYGGGQRFYDELLNENLQLNVQGFLYGPMPTQPLGWYPRPIRSPSDLRGLRVRAAGLTAELLRELGMLPTALPATDIVPAISQGLIDAGEFNNPTSDRALGFPGVAKVCMMRSMHQTCEVFDVLINRRRWEALPAELRSIVRYAIQAASSDMSWKAAERYARDYDELRGQGVKFVKTPDAVLQAQLKAWKVVMEKEAGRNPLFGRIVESQMAFARRVVGYRLDADMPTRMAYEFWFGKRSIDT
jgi:TRAP-type mannitol/chloroaromatic compound transport system substrate-binding protein